MTAAEADRRDRIAHGAPLVAPPRHLMPRGWARGERRRDLMRRKVRGMATMRWPPLAFRSDAPCVYVRGGESAEVGVRSGAEALRFVGRVMSSGACSECCQPPRGGAAATRCRRGSVPGDTAVAPRRCATSVLRSAVQSARALSSLRGEGDGAECGAAHRCSGGGAASSIGMQSWTCRRRSSGASGAAAVSQETLGCEPLVRLLRQRGGARRSSSRSTWRCLARSRSACRDALRSAITAGSGYLAGSLGWERALFNPELITRTAVCHTGHSWHS